MPLQLVEPETHKPPFKFATVLHGSTAANLYNYHRDMYNYMKKYNKTSVDEGIKAVKDGQVILLSVKKKGKKSCRCSTWRCITF